MTPVQSEIVQADTLALILNQQRQYKAYLESAQFRLASLQREYLSIEAIQAVIASPLATIEAYAQGHTTDRAVFLQAARDIIRFIFWNPITNKVELDMSFYKTQTGLAINYANTRRVNQVNLCTIAQAAALIKMSRQALYNVIHGGKLIPLFIAEKPFLYYPDIAAWRIEEEKTNGY